MSNQDSQNKNPFGFSWRKVSLAESVLTITATGDAGRWSATGDAGRWSVTGDASPRSALHVPLANKSIQLDVFNLSQVKVLAFLNVSFAGDKILALATT